MSVAACAEIVARADPDRFLATMAAPPRARAVLFALYAMNVEVSRAPWVTQEAMIAEMRLQWWRDAIAEIAGAGPVRRHEVVDAMADVLDSGGAAMLDGLIEMRRWDIYTEAFEDTAHFDSYIEETSATLMWVAARALGSTTEDAVRAHGRAMGIAHWLLAAPELGARGRVPLLDGRPEGLAALARRGLAALDGAERIDAAARPAVLAGWQARTLLRRAVAQPERVAAGALAISPARKRLSLMVKSAL